MAQKISIDDFDVSLIKRLSDRHFGIGCDQFILLDYAEKYDIKMLIFNQDGSIAKSCGNATRCVARYLFDKNRLTQIIIEAPDRHLQCVLVSDGQIAVNMGKAQFDLCFLDLDPSLLEISTSKGIDAKHITKDDWELMICSLLPTHDFKVIKTGVFMGNPHLVLYFEHALWWKRIDICQWGQRIGQSPFFKNGINVGFLTVDEDADHKDLKRFRLKVYERGVGFTLACGSGACAAYAALQKQILSDEDITKKQYFKNIKTPIDMIVDGGKLKLWHNEKHEIMMQGPAEYSFKGFFKEGSFN
ncbi:MAG: diaminopimelate epimerase [Pseudomonadota bacterium]